MRIAPSMRAHRVRGHRHAERRLERGREQTSDLFRWRIYVLGREARGGMRRDASRSRPDGMRGPVDHLSDVAVDRCEPGQVADSRGHDCPASGHRNRFELGGQIGRDRCEQGARLGRRHVQNERVEALEAGTVLGFQRPRGSVVLDAFDAGFAGYVEVLGKVVDEACDVDRVALCSGDGHYKAGGCPGVDVAGEAWILGAECNAAMIESGVGRCSRRADRKASACSASLVEHCDRPAVVGERPGRDQTRHARADHRNAWRRIVRRAARAGRVRRDVQTLAVGCCIAGANGS